MVSMGMASIRFEVSELSVSKSGWTTLFVDQNYVAASDDNDGYSWARPKKTIGGALADAKSWCKIFVNSGEYEEEVTIPYEHVQIVGVAKDGPDIVNIKSSIGTPITITAGFCELKTLAIEAEDQHGIQATAPGHLFDDVVIAVTNTTGVARIGIWLNDSDSTKITNCYIDGNNDDEVIGILVGDDTVGAVIGGRDHDSNGAGNYITGCGSGVGADCGAGGACVANGYGIGVAESAQRTQIFENEIIDCCVGVYFYKVGADAFKGHAVLHNAFWENCSFDVFDQYTPSISAIAIRENYLGYTNWFEDPDNSGRAAIIVDCNTNKDYAPLANQHIWRTEAISRAGHI